MVRKEVPWKGVNAALQLPPQLGSLFHLHLYKTIWPQSSTCQALKSKISYQNLFDSKVLKSSIPGGIQNYWEAFVRGKDVPKLNFILPREGGKEKG